MDKTINAENQGQPDAESCPSEKEQAILNAATRLFSQYGYTGTTTVSIAQEANVSEKTLFKYFHTKQELYNKALYPSIMTLIKEKIGRSQENDRGIYGILHDLYQEKLQVANENPDLLKLTIHEFLMNEEFRSEMSKIWTTTYLPTLTKEIQLSDENRAKYGPVLEGGLTRAMVALLVAYTIDKSYIRPQGVFDDQKEIEFMLDLLFNGINGLKK